MDKTLTINKNFLCDLIEQALYLLTGHQLTKKNGYFILKKLKYTNK